MSQVANLFGVSESEVIARIENRSRSAIATAETAGVRPKLQYSRREAAALLGVGLRTLDRLIAIKEISVRRVGRRVVIPQDTLSQFTRRDHRTN